MPNSALGRYTNTYRAWLDGKPTKMECLADTKTGAWKWLCDREWHLFFPGKPLPSRRRVKFERIESVFG